PFPRRTLHPTRFTLFPYTTLFRSRRRIPVILDLVGIGCSGLRRTIVREFLEMRERCSGKEKEPAPLVLKGNLSEIRVLAGMELGDRKSTRLNSSHVSISYAVFCLK